MAYKLLVDLGNTRLKWARLKDGALGPATRIPLGDALISDVLQKAWPGFEAPESVWVSSVASNTTESALRNWCNRRWPDVNIRFPRAQAHAFDVSCAYDQPERMGVDRWLALVAARRQFKAPVCVVDVGTAVTLDALDGEGTHLGGLILPGIALAAKLLTEYTGRLRLHAEPERVARAGNTEDAVYSGTYWAIVALIERFIDDLESQLGQSVALLLTGGDAEAIRESLHIDSHLAPDLVLTGLSVVSA